MSLECSECERDLRGGHDPSCSRYVQHEPHCAFLEDDEAECDCKRTMPNKKPKRTRPRTQKMIRLEARYRRQLKLCGFRSYVRAQQRRSELIDKHVDGTASPDELAELERLQTLVGYYADWKTNDSIGRSLRRTGRLLKKLESMDN